MCKTAEGSNVLRDGSNSGGRPTLFDPQWKFENMGVGGRDKQFRAIFRRAFLSRIMLPEVR
jgi:vesicle-fusing ATPase